MNTIFNGVDWSARINAFNLYITFSDGIEHFETLDTFGLTINDMRILLSKSLNLDSSMMIEKLNHISSN